MSKNLVFWIDGKYDQEHAEEGSSRYSQELRRNMAAFTGLWGDIAPVAFACAAWRVATPPVMSPGYVRCHRRVLSASCRRNEWDGTMNAHVELVSPMPAELTASREWWHDRGWQGWPEIFGQFVEPAEQDRAKIPYLRTTLLVDVPVPLDGLPAAPDQPEGMEKAARRAVAVLVRELNDILAPILRRLT